MLNCRSSRMRKPVKASNNVSDLSRTDVACFLLLDTDETRHVLCYWLSFPAPVRFSEAIQLEQARSAQKQSIQPDEHLLSLVDGPLSFKEGFKVSLSRPRLASGLADFQSLLQYRPEHRPLKMAKSSFLDGMRLSQYISLESSLRFWVARLSFRREWSLPSPNKANYRPNVKPLADLAHKRQHASIVLFPIPP